MKYHTQCPECKHFKTERVYTEWLESGVEQTRICNTCPTQYTISYRLTSISVDFTEEETDV